MSTDRVLIAQKPTRLSPKARVSDETRPSAPEFEQTAVGNKTRQKENNALHLVTKKVCSRTCARWKSSQTEETYCTGIVSVLAALALTELVPWPACTFMCRRMRWHAISFAPSGVIWKSSCSKQVILWRPVSSPNRIFSTMSPKSASSFPSLAAISRYRVKGTKCLPGASENPCCVFGKAPSHRNSGSFARARSGPVNFILTDHNTKLLNSELRLSITRATLVRMNFISLPLGASNLLSLGSFSRSSSETRISGSNETQGHVGSTRILVQLKTVSDQKSSLFFA